MTVFLPGNASFFQGMLVDLLDGAIVGYEHIVTHFLTQYGRTCAAFSGAEDDESLHDQRILRVAMAKTAKIRPTIQKRMTILDSGMGCKGVWIKASMPALPGF
ncbi:MAG: hypothetical protein BWY72_00132 [Bacteroidetes bacterium ADurb.Bin416]|nr:MAG: hypothetical protein BWY72_00132 [Bacteroidetes bacterium ADurb.Bin416]